MIAKKWIAILMVMALPLGFAGMSFSADELNGVDVAGESLSASSEQEVRGTISKIEGTTIILVNDNGEQITVHVRDAKMLKDLKMGDRVLVKDGKVIKEKA